MMNIFKLDRKQYKKLAKDFRNTYVGGRLFLIFDSLLCLYILGNVLEILTQFTEEKDILLGPITDINLGLLFIGVLISYYVYFRYLKEYIEKNGK